MTENEIVNSAEPWFYVAIETNSMGEHDEKEIIQVIIKAGAINLALALNEDQARDLAVALLDRRDKTMHVIGKTPVFHCRAADFMAAGRVELSAKTLGCKVIKSENMARWVKELA